MLMLNTKRQKNGCGERNSNKNEAQSPTERHFVLLIVEKYLIKTAPNSIQVLA